MKIRYHASKISSMATKILLILILCISLVFNITNVALAIPVPIEQGEFCRGVCDDAAICSHANASFKGQWEFLDSNYDKPRCISTKTPYNRLKQKVNESLIRELENGNGVINKTTPASTTPMEDDQTPCELLDFAHLENRFYLRQGTFNESSTDTHECHH